MTQTLIAWGIIAAVLGTAAALTWAIRRNLSRGERTRLSLLQRLLHVRLSGVMQVMGIDPRGYLSHATVVEVERQLRVCQNCAHQHRCTGDLSIAASEDYFGYCPVYASLTSVREALAATEYSVTVVLTVSEPPGWANARRSPQGMASPCQGLQRGSSPSGGLPAGKAGSGHLPCCTRLN